MNSKWYWLIHQKYVNLKFIFKRSFFKIKQKKEMSKRFSSFSKMVIVILMAQIVINMALVTALYICDRLLLLVLENLVKKYAIKTTIAIATISADVVIGGIGVAGVILGLYCSNMTSLYSSKYTNAPTSITSVFQKDVVTNRCIKQITSYIIFCVILLFGCLLKISFSYISIISLLFLTIRMIITFSITGNRTYQLSNTFNISDNLYPEIYSAIKKASADDCFSNDPNFQNYYQEVCTKKFEILKDIAIYNKDNPANQNPAMLSFMNHNLALINVYWETKEKIYYDSFWYRSEIQYKKWHIATDTEVSLALNSGTSLQTTPKTRNKWWFEQDLLHINNICVEKLCTDIDLTTLYSYLNNVAKLSSKTMEYECLLSWVTSIISLQEKVLPICICEEQNSFNDNTIVAAAISDIFIGIYLNIIIGINKYIRELNIDLLLKQAIESDFYKPFKPNNRYFNNKKVEHLFHCILMEHKLESKRITPDWYIKQTIAYAIYQDLNTAVDVLGRIYNNIFYTGKQLAEKKCYLQGATTLTRLFELSSKTSLTTNILEHLFSFLETLHFEPTEIWEDCKLKDFLDRKKSINREFPPYLMRCCCATTLTHWKKHKDFPDSLGFCYNHLCEYLVAAIENGDFESFKVAYTGFWGVTLLYHEYVRSDLIKIKETYKQNAVFHVVTAPILEYAVISGLAILWGEFSGEKQWKDLIDEELNAYVNKSDNQNDTLIKIIEMLSYRKNHQHGIGNRDIIQTNWNQRITNSIIAKGFCHYEYKHPGIKVLKTDSTFLKAFCQTTFDDLGFTNGVEEAYLILCLNQYVPPEKQYKSQFKWEKDLYETNT